MITDRDPTPEELAKAAKSERWNCVAAALFTITFAALGIFDLVRAKSQVPSFSYALLALAIGYVFIFWRSLRRYKELV
jgi:hypothetical protein